MIRVLLALFRIVLLILFGLLVFSITIIALISRNELQMISNSKISRNDSCIFKMPNSISTGKIVADEVIFYIESESCTSCAANVITSVLSYTQDSVIRKKPILIIRPQKDIDSAEVDDYKLRFEDKFDLIVSNDDSLRILNPWLPKYLGYYGITTDSLGFVSYAGFLFDSVFINSLSREIKPNKYEVDLFLD